MPTQIKHSRPHMPGYGVVAENEGAGLLPWSFVEERATRSMNYWINSTHPDGRPHAAPVWGLWHAGAFYFSTGDLSRKGRNIAANPAISMHLESGAEAVMLEGHAEEVKDQSVLKDLDKAYKTKYGMKMQGPGVVYKLSAQRAFAWREHDFPQSATRWVFK